MQLELLELTIVGLVLLPLVVLAILFLLDFQKSEGRAKITAIYGFLTFILMFLYFLVNWLFIVDVSIIVVLFGTAFTFMPVWAISFTKSEYLEKWRIPFAIIFLVIWAAYIVPRLFMALNLSFYFQTIVYALAIIFLLLGVMDDYKVLILITGLALVYLERAWTFADALTETLVLLFGCWLVLIWYLLKKRG
ncbi:MAG: hypothetical protein ACFFAX_11850 [Promethearchaeota archaeon]